MTSSLDPIAEAKNLRAREVALQAAASVPMQPTGEVAYQSQGRVLVIGEQHAALQLARKLAGGPLQPAVLVCGAPAPLPGDAGVPVLFGADRRIRVEGHLGAFRVLVEADGGEIEVAPTLDRHCSAMDLVVDLRQPPLLDLEMLPPGYYAPADASAVERVVAELPELVGEFVKPRYFRYDPEICAHGRSGLSGCRRCLDACPAGAIVSLRERIEVDPQLCQGGGACATACPTGAIVYAYPGPRDMGNRLRVLLRSFREAGGEAPILLFHDGEAGAALLAGLTGPIPARVLPVEVEEVGSVGLELWFASLAHGAARVLLLDPGGVPPKVRAELRAQLATADTILSGLGYPPGAVALLSSPDGAALTEAAAEELMPGIGAAGFAGSERKRDTLFLALDHLIAEAGAAVAQPAIELAEGAPFGEIQVDPKACTLCLSCVSVCPASALADGVDQPLLALVEANCVQCGLCEIACPENAITRHPRLLLDPKARSRPRTLHRELAFHCVKCGAPFATASVVTRITEKLTGHRMFQDPEARRRLQMCGDCRVKDLLQHERDR